MTVFPRGLTEGVELALCDMPEAPGLFAMMERNRESLGRWLPWAHASQRVGDVIEFLVRARQQFEDGNGFHAGVFVKGDLAGFVGLHPIDWANRRVELGYWLDEDFRGRGVMTVAVRGAVELCFRHYGLNRVEIRCGVENAASCAIAERLGFRLEGVLRQAQWIEGRAIDLRVYAMLADEIRSGG